MIVGVPKEIYPGERRVALTPAVVPMLAKAGLEVVIESSESEDSSSSTSPLHPPEHFTPVKSGPSQEITTPSKPQSQKFHSLRPSPPQKVDWDEVTQDETFSHGRWNKKAPKQFLGDFLY